MTSLNDEIHLPDIRMWSIFFIANAPSGDVLVKFIIIIIIVSMKASLFDAGFDRMHFKL